MLRSSLLVLAMLLAAGAELSAQQIPPLERLQRVRLTTATLHDVVAVPEMTADNLIAHSFKGGGEVRVPLTATERLEVSRGYPFPHRSVSDGAGIGLLVGGAPGAVLGYSKGDDQRFVIGGHGDGSPIPSTNCPMSSCGVCARSDARTPTGPSPGGMGDSSPRNSRSAPRRHESADACISL